MDKEDSNIHNISGLSFKDLSEDKEKIDDPYILLDDDLEDEKDLSWIRKFGRDLAEKFNTRRGFVAFVIDFIEYLVSRVRVIWILLSVLFELIYRQFDIVKNNVVKRMFWGRGDFLKYISQAGVVIIAFILALSLVYRAPAITNANEGDLDYIGVPEGDTIAMTATLNTLTPEDREKRDSEVYIVMNGDTLSKIASKFSISIDTIKWANDMTNDIVKPGQELDIPPTDGVLIKVSKGDTLAGVAKKYKGSEQAIADFNWLDYPFTLVEGEQLFIPDGEMPSAPKPVYASTPQTYVSGSSRVNYSVGAADPNVGKFLGWPVAKSSSAFISQYYKGAAHRGIDIADRSLPNLVAAASGTVIFAGCAGTCPPLGSTWGGSGYAWAVQIDHGNGYTTYYAHMKNIYVKTGQRVSKGQAIGQLGSTGRSTGPHVHFELRKGVSYGTQVNPIYYANW